MRPDLAALEKGMPEGDMGEESDMGAAPGIQMASTIREAIESKDDEALYDSLWSLYKMYANESEADKAPAPAAPAGKKPSLVVTLGKSK